MKMPSQLARVQNFIIDMDGVIYRGKVPIPGAGQFLDALRTTGTPFLLLTNNASLTEAQYAARLAEMGIEMEPERILTSGEATAMYLAQVAPPGTPVFAIGEDGLRTPLEKRGFVLRDDPDVDYVVVGFDRGFSYQKLSTATLAIRAGAQFIGANPDKTYPNEQGLVPGNGALLAAIEAATDTAPLVIGKPQPAIFELALQKLQAQPKTTAILGDRMETDILGGLRVGLVTVLLLSGVMTREQLAQESLVPDLVYEDIAAFHLAWEKAHAGRAGSRTRRERPGA
jgi:4-nitrophenyl phosphatase